MNGRTTKSFAWVASVSLATGCSTAYMPRPNPRVQVITKGGTPSYVRDGRVYEGGIFGGDLEEAVRGNPEAESHARAYHTGMVTGFISSLIGGASMGGGLALLVAGTNGSSGSDTTKQSIGGTLAVGGLATYILGVVLLASAEPHIWDAINVYNDGVPDIRYAPPPFAPAPYGAAPNAPPPQYLPPRPVLPAPAVPPPANPQAPAPRPN